MKSPLGNGALFLWIGIALFPSCTLTHKGEIDNPSLAAIPEKLVLPEVARNLEMPLVAKQLVSDAAINLGLPEAARSFLSGASESANIPLASKEFLANAAREVDLPSAAKQILSDAALNLFMPEVAQKFLSDALRNLDLPRAFKQFLADGFKEIADAMEAFPMKMEQVAHNLSEHLKVGERFEEMMERQEDLAKASYKGHVAIKAAIYFGVVIGIGLFFIKVLGIPTRRIGHQRRSWRPPFGKVNSPFRNGEIFQVLAMAVIAGFIISAYEGFNLICVEAGGELGSLEWTEYQRKFRDYFPKFGWMFVAGAVLLSWASVFFYELRTELGAEATEGEEGNPANA